MVATIYLATAAVLLGVTAAAPTTNKGFTIQQKPKGLKAKMNPVQKMAQPYRKFRKQMPAQVAAAAATQTGTVAATPSDPEDDEYDCPVKVGSQTLSMDFDTGSSDFWVFSTQLPASESAGHTLYSPGSSAKKLSGYTWNISYGDGSGASGDVYTDTVDIGGVSVTQGVEAATSVSSTFTSDTADDGLVGLAFDSINTVTPQKQATFIQNAIPSLPSPLFTADLKYHAVGSYDFGFIDATKHTGSITYMNVNTANGFWEFTGNGYAVGSGSFVSSSIDAIADTGTTLLYLPTGVVSAYYAQVSGAKNSAAYGGYVFPCSATLPSITLGFGSYKAVVPGTYINYSPVQTGSSTCFGGIQSDTGIGFAIWGDIFLKSQFVVFDMASTPQLGLAPKAT